MSTHAHVLPRTNLPARRLSSLMEAGELFDLPVLSSTQAGAAERQAWLLKRARDAEIAANERDTALAALTIGSYNNPDVMPLLDERVRRVIGNILSISDMTFVSQTALMYKK